jgi:hypothetical protein
LTLAFFKKKLKNDLGFGWVVLSAVGWVCEAEEEEAEVFS